MAKTFFDNIAMPSRPTQNASNTVSNALVNFATGRGATENILNKATRAAASAVRSANTLNNWYGGGSGGGGGGGGQSGPSAVEQQAADRLKEIARYNAGSTMTQANQNLANYDYANQQNRALADTQLQQNRRKTSADRFEAQRDLQNAALGLFGSMGNAMNSSSTGNLMRMLEDRNDKENNVYWAQLQSNQDQVENAYNDSLNQNNVAKNETLINAQKALSDIQADLSANLNNVNPDLYEAPGTGSVQNGDYFSQNRVAPNLAQISGYVMPDNRRGAERNRVLGNDYFSRLINSFNGR